MPALRDEPDSDLPADRAIPTAWRLLTSVGTLLTLATLTALLLTWGALVPQQISPVALAPRLPFAQAEALLGLGLTDVLTSWPFLVLLTLLLLNLAGITLRRHFIPPASRPAPTTATLPYPLAAVQAALPGAKLIHNQLKFSRGFAKLSAVLVFTGLALSATGLILQRAAPPGHELTVFPGTTLPSTATTRHADVVIAQLLPYAITCARPDPQDPARSLTCTRDTPAATFTLTPGRPTRLDGHTLTLTASHPRAPTADEPIALVVTHDDSVERLTLTPNTPTTLQRTGDVYRAWHGPDGPIVLITSNTAPPALLTPTPLSALPTPLSAQPTTSLTLRITPTPSPLLIHLGLGITLLALLLLALRPELTLSASPHAADATRIAIRSLNRPHLAEKTLAELRRTLANRP